MGAPESKSDKVVECAKAQEKATSEFLHLFGKGEKVNHIEFSETEVEVIEVKMSSNTVGVFSKIIGLIPFLRRG